MKFEERSYGGKIFRPAPHIEVNEERQILTLCTAWGDNQMASKAAQHYQNHLLSQDQDHELTSPFGVIKSLSHIENQMRHCLILTNDLLYREFNNETYSSGFEFCSLQVVGSTLYYLCYGQPHVYLKRGKHIFHLHSEHDLSLDTLFDPQDLAPLPRRLLGIETNPQVQPSSIKIMPKDEILLLCRNTVPTLDVNRSKWTLTALSRTLAISAENQPFWIGLVRLS